MDELNKELPEDEVTGEIENTDDDADIVNAAAVTDEAVSDDEKEQDEAEQAPAERVKASGKTTAVLLCTIAVLVIVVVVCVVVIARKFASNSKPDSEVTPVPTQEAVTGGAETTPTEAPVNPAEQEYNVTITLGQYKGLEADYEKAEIGVDEVLEKARELCEEFTENKDVTDRPVQSGDTVSIDFTGYMDGEPFEGGTATDYKLEIGSGSFIDGFEDGLIGVNIGETVTLDLNFPDPYPNNTDYSGKPVKFDVKVNSITETVIPELTDEFVAQNTEFTNTSDYVASVREELMAEAETEADAQLREELLTKAIENASFGGDIDKEIEDTVAYWMSYYDNMYKTYYGVDAITFFGAYYGWDENEYKDFMNEQYGMSVKMKYVLAKIAEVENITVSEEEYESKFSEMFFDYYGFTSKEEVFENISAEEADKIINDTILQEKAEQIIVDNAVVNK